MCAFAGGWMLAIHTEHILNAPLACAGVQYVGSMAWAGAVARVSAGLPVEPTVRARILFRAITRHAARVAMNRRAQAYQRAVRETA